MKIKLAIACVLVCMCAITVQAQTKVVAIAEIGDARTFGYSFPDMSIGVQVEQPVLNHFEMQGTAGWSPTNKRAIGNGNSGFAKVSGIAWLHKNIGFIAGLRYGHLWTSLYHKGGMIGSGGFVLRIYDDDIRLYAIHTRQLFEGIDKQGIETSNTRGLEVTPEIKFGRYRVGFRYVLVKGLSQGNPQCDGTFVGPITCPRDPWLALSNGVRLGFEF